MGFVFSTEERFRCVILMVADVQVFYPSFRQITLMSINLLLFAG
jgi:hypothetical protein